MSIRGIIEQIVGFINGQVIPLLFAIALLLFLYGVARYLFIEGDNAEGRKKAGKVMLWGIIGLTVMAGMWGIVALLLNTFSLT